MKKVLRIANNKDIKRAEESWKNGEYSKAQELYEKHISSLSKAQIKKLEYIRKNA